MSPPTIAGGAVFPEGHLAPVEVLGQRSGAAQRAQGAKEARREGRSDIKVVEVGSQAAMVTEALAASDPPPTARWLAVSGMVVVTGAPGRLPRVNCRR